MDLPLHSGRHSYHTSVWAYCDKIRQEKQLRHLWMGICQITKKYPSLSWRNSGFLARHTPPRPLLAIPQYEVLCSGGGCCACRDVRVLREQTTAGKKSIEGVTCLSCLGIAPPLGVATKAIGTVNSQGFSRASLGSARNAAGASKTNTRGNHSYQSLANKPRDVFACKRASGATLPVTPTSPTPRSLSRVNTAVC